MPKIPTFEARKRSKAVLSNNPETKRGRKHAKQYTGLAAALKKAEGAHRTAKSRALTALRKSAEWKALSNEEKEEKEASTIASADVILEHKREELMKL